MDTKILASLMVIGLVASAIGMGTYAYFSDTETSTGNTFTAGAIDLKIDSTCKYNGQTQKFCTWESKDLGTGDVFFNFNDVKPGDFGEDTISFDLTSNPAWACIYVTNIVDSDNGCNGPELKAEPNCLADGNGELDEHLYVTIWVDDGAGNSALACNNELDTNERIIVDNKPLSKYIDGQTSVVIPVADKNNLPVLQPGRYCIGIKWSVPPTTGNDVQTDKVGADLSFYVEQARNNPDFVCPQTIPGRLH